MLKGRPEGQELIAALKLTHSVVRGIVGRSHENYSRASLLMVEQYLLTSNPPSIVKERKMAFDGFTRALSQWSPSVTSVALWLSRLSTLLDAQK
jgi:hypothetical protein